MSAVFRSQYAPGAVFGEQEIGSGTGSASGSFASIGLSAIAASAQGAAIASGDLAGITLSPATGTADAPSPIGNASGEFAPITLTAAQAAQVRPQMLDTHDGFWAKEWARIRAREKRKYREEIEERVEEIQDEIAEVEQQIAEVKQVAKPKKAVVARDFYSEQARIVEHLIARRNQLIDEEDEELLLLL